MTLSDALYTYLSTYAGLVALIGTDVYHGRMPHRVEAPYVSWWKISEPQVTVMGTNDGPYHPRVQFSCFGNTPDDAEDVAVQVKKALTDYSGVMGGGSGVTIQRIFFDDENEIDTPDGDTSGVLYGVALDFIIWYEETR